jgi:hypothetical protein
MNSTAHTPGPWTCFYKPKYDEWHISLPIAGSSMKLALCADGIQSENREADAHLIAAAPDMLAALKRCEEMVSTANGPPNWDWVREVIAKAEGRTS